MAPFRSRDRSNRLGRGQIEHNVLEGLPINQYRESEITIGPNLTDNKPVDKNAWPELPMPRDSHMLPEHSQQILRAVRSGRTYKPPPPPEDDNEMKDEEEEHKEVQSGFTVKKYVKIPRHLEVAELEYLAKRRRGLPSPYINGQLGQTALRETKVKKLDAEGNVAVYKVLVPEGQAVEGELQPTDAAIEAAPATAAPGTVVEGVGVVNAEGVVVANDIMQQTPPRRRPPPPKKKVKRAGPGRGKKKVLFAEGGVDHGTPASNADSDSLAVPGVKQDEGSVPPSDGGDTPMAEAGADDDEGSGEEGSDDEDQDMDNTSNPATPPPLPAAPAAPAAPASEPATDLTDLTDLTDVMDITPLEAVAAPEPPIALSIEIPQPSVEEALPAMPMRVLDISEQHVEPDLSISLDGQLPDTPDNLTSALHEAPALMIDTELAIPEIPSEFVVPDTELELEPELELLTQPATEPEPQIEMESEVEATFEVKPKPEVELALESKSGPEPVQDTVQEPLQETAQEIVQETFQETLQESVQEPVPLLPPVVETVSEVVIAPLGDISTPASEPDLLESLEKHLERDIEDISGS